MIKYIIILYLVTAFTVAADVDLKNLNDAIGEDNGNLCQSATLCTDNELLEHMNLCTKVLISVSYGNCFTSVLAPFQILI